jgi:hypothetical protein
VVVDGVDVLAFEGREHFEGDEGILGGAYVFDDFHPGVSLSGQM